MTRDHRYSARTDRACRRWTWVSLWPRPFLSEGDLRSCLRHVPSCFACLGASSFVSFSPATAPQPSAGSKK